ncbi:MAG: polysaccharide biosynthesis/export family protein [Candidatus Omnitrophota bacterium]
MYKNKYKSCLLIIFALSFLGCVTANPVLESEIESEIKKIETELSQSQEEQPKPFEYKIGPEDILEVGVWQGFGRLEKAKEKGPENEYTISTGDVLDISVWQWPDLAKIVIVRPDGKISFPLVDDIYAEGLTLTELDGILTEKLKEFIKSPEVSVMVQEFGKRRVGFEKVEDLSKELMVRPDGKISLPLLGDVQAEGLSLNELSGTLTEKLKDLLSSPKVSISLKQIGGKKIIVLGEVKNPGVYKPTGIANILEAIALAGGFSEHAVLNSVIIIRGAPFNPEIRRVNLTRAIDKGQVSSDLLTQPEDIIYVPKKFIANLNYFLTQLIDPIYKASSVATQLQTLGF